MLEKYVNIVEDWTQLRVCIRIGRMGANTSTEQTTDDVLPPPVVSEDEPVGNILQVILIDRSSSMNVGNYAKTVADNIVIPSIKALSDKCDTITIAVSTFSDILVHDVPFKKISAFDADIELELRAKLPKTANGTTRYFESVSDTIEMIRKHLVMQHRKSYNYDRVALTVFSDGSNTVSCEPNAESFMNEQIDKARAEGWVLSFVGIEHNASTSTKSARFDEVFNVASRFDDDGFEQCTRACSTRVLSAPVSAVHREKDTEVADLQGKNSEDAPTRTNGRYSRVDALANSE
jgi:hypothetical protein